MFLAPSDPPYMSKNIVVHHEKFNIGNVCQIFLGPFIYVTTFSFHFQKNFQYKTFTANVTVTGVRWTF